MKILIAEDTEDSRMMLDMALTAEGYKVISCINGREALEKTRENHPDLIISDIMMPEMDGYEYCKLVKADPELKKIPFIFYTATYTEKQDEDLAMALGASRFVIKPMEIEALVEIVNKEIKSSGSSGVQAQHDLQKPECDLDNMHLHSISKKLDKKISELEKEREALKQSEEKYRHLVESIQDYYFFYTQNTEGVFTYLSPSVEYVLGYSPETMLRHYSEHLTNNPINEKAAQHSKLSIKGEEQAPFEVEIYHNDGSIHWLEVKEIPVFDQNSNVSYIEGIANDITMRKQAEEIVHRSQKMNALGQLTGGIAHDYNNMLGVIVGYSELIEQALIDRSRVTERIDDLKNYIQQIIHASERGSRLSQKLLSFARQKTADERTVNINNILKSQQNMLEKTLTSRINLVLDLADGLWPVKLDSNDFEDAILNMCINAMHAINSNGQLQIETNNLAIEEIECRKLDLKPGEYVVVDFVDNGCGIEKDEIDKIFEPFYTSKGDNGTGLGLSQVYGFMKRSNGIVHVESIPGVSTRFSMYFPRDYSSAEQLNGTLHQKNNLDGNETILVVDDEPELLKLTTTILGQHGYNVFSAHNGKQALEMIEKLHVDLLITDVIMPEMDGYKLAHIVQEKFPQIKIQIISGFNDNLHKKYPDKTLFKSMLTKPIDSQSLLEKIRELLNQ